MFSFVSVLSQEGRLKSNQCRMRRYYYCLKYTAKVIDSGVKEEGVRAKTAKPSQVSMTGKKTSSWIYPDMHSAEHFVLR